MSVYTIAHLRLSITNDTCDRFFCNLTNKVTNKVINMSDQKQHLTSYSRREML